MKKILLFISIFLLVVIIAEVAYLFSRPNKQQSEVPITESEPSNSETLITDESGVTLTPTLTHIPIPSNYNPPEYIVLEGKVFYLEAMDEADFVYRVKIIQADGKAKNIQFEHGDLDIMNVTRTDPQTNQKVGASFDDIDLNDTIKIELFIDQEAQRKTVQTITNYRIDITIL